MNLKSDNVLMNFKPTLAELCCLSTLKGADTIKPENTPLLVEVEAYREKDIPATAPQSGTRYGLVLPGSNYLRIVVKVEERTPSITQDVLAKYPGGIRVRIDGFLSGTFPGKDGGANSYFRADRITPLQAQPTK